MINYIRRHVSFFVIIVAIHTEYFSKLEITGQSNITEHTRLPYLGQICHFGYKPEGLLPWSHNKMKLIMDKAINMLD